MSSEVVLDAAALLCLLNDQSGADGVIDVLIRGIIGPINLAEVVSKLRDGGFPLDEVREALGGLYLDVGPLSPAQVLIVGDLRPSTNVRLVFLLGTERALPWQSTCKRRCSRRTARWRAPRSVSPPPTYGAGGAAAHSCFGV